MVGEPTRFWPMKASDWVRCHLPGCYNPTNLHRSPLVSIHNHLAGIETVSFKELVQQAEDEVNSWALKEAGGEQQRAAQLLGLPRTTLQSKLTKGN